MPIPGAQRVPTHPGRAREAPRAITWVGGVLGALTLAVAIALSLGLAAIVWIPLLFLLGGAMCAVWIARRRRQNLEGRSERDIKDPQHAAQPWKSEELIDDRLPDP